MLPDKRAEFERAMARATSDFLDHRERYENGADDDGDARMEFEALLDAVASLAGDAVLRGALGQLQSGEGRAAALDTIGWRATLVSTLTRTIGDVACFSRVADEAEAIAAGDTPALFARVGHKKVKYREYRAKLKALCWERVLQDAGLSVRDRRHAIEGAYSTSWNTISKWDREARSVLGDALVDRELGRASRLIRGNRGLPSTWRLQLGLDANRLKAAAEQSRGGSSGMEL